MNEAKQLYLEWFKSVKGFDWSFNAEDEAIIEDLYRWLDNDIDQWKKFLLAIIKNPQANEWLLNNLKPYTINRKRQDIRMKMESPIDLSGLKAAPPPPMSQDEREWRIWYDKNREYEKAWVSYVRMRRKALQDFDWMPEQATQKVDGRPRGKYWRADSELPEGVTRIN